MVSLYWGASREAKVLEVWRKYQISRFKDEDAVAALIALVSTIYSYLRLPWAKNRKMWLERLSCVIAEVLDEDFPYRAQLNPDQVDVAVTVALYLCKQYPLPIGLWGTKELLVDLNELARQANASGSVLLYSHTYWLLMAHTLRIIQLMDWPQTNRILHSDFMNLSCHENIQDSRQRARVWRYFAQLCAESHMYNQAFRAFGVALVAGLCTIGVQVKTLLAGGLIARRMLTGKSCF